TNLSTYLFNKEITKLEEKVEIKWTKNLTDIKNSLEKIIFKNKNLDAILLFSDGNDSFNRYPDLFDSKTKIYPVNLDEDSFNDVAIKDLRYSQIGFKDIEHEISCQLLNYGYEGKTINIILEGEGRVFDTKKVNLKTGENDVKLKFIPKEIGKKKFIIKIDNLPKEVTYENNIKKIEVEIKKNKIRILYICGQPSYEYYFLRSLLKNDTNIDLVSFVILRNNDSQVIVPDEDLSLIPFPIYDIFVKEVNNYDLILFENFSYRKFSIPLQYLENIRRYVISGGGFIMLGGENSFYSGGYKNTPIEEILPVELDESEQIIKKEFIPKIVKFNNQLLKIYEDIKTNELIWKSVPRLKNYHRFVAKPLAEVLVLHNEDRFKENFVPIMVYWTVGKGRVFVSGTNTTWMWGLGNMLSKSYDFKNLYTQFWKNIIYWAGGASEIKKIYILFDRENFSVEDIVKVRVVVFSETNIFPDLWVTFPDLSKKKLSLKKISSNEYLGEIRLSLEGKYIFNAYLSDGKVSYKDVRDIYVEKSVAQEIVNLKINEKYLNKIAEMSNGKVFNYNNFNVNKVIDDIKQKISKEYVASYDIYSSPIIIILFIIIFLLEIYLIRRFR
ncbi:MAG: glutamine amidotransferase, partial [Endomicrobiia bacterium]